MKWRSMMFIILLFMLAVLTHVCVSWAGSNLHEVGNVESKYALFTFSDDRHEKMSVNILLNILVPNVIMLILAVCFKKLNLIL